MGLANLQDLTLTGTEVTDVGLVYLKELTKLQDLDVAETQVTNEGVDKLREALPKCVVGH